MDDLSNKYENENESSGILLEPQEKLILEQIAAGGPPHSQRAQSLLAIDAGVTQTTAALQTGAYFLKNCCSTSSLNRLPPCNYQVS
jgi:hypothetical protein